MTYTKPQRLKKEKSERLRGEGDQIKFIDLRFERWQVVADHLHNECLIKWKTSFYRKRTRVVG